MIKYHMREFRPGTQEDDTVAAMNEYVNAEAKDRFYVESTTSSGEGFNRCYLIVTSRYNEEDIDEQV